MASGIALKPECIDAFKEMKLRKNRSYLIFKIEDGLKNIVIAETGELGETFEDFRAKLMDAKVKGQGRYAVYDVTEGQDENSKSKTGNLVFITWVPDDDLSIKQKMIYATTNDVIKKSFEGVQVYLQINDPTDLTLENITAKLGDKAKQK